MMYLLPEDLQVPSEIRRVLIYYIHKNILFIIAVQPPLG